MATAPYGVRLLVGATVTALEETRKLPQTIMTYPMTVVSQAAHLVMRWQQNVAELVIKGDETLEQIFPPKDEQPEWATFDEDDEASEPAVVPTPMDPDAPAAVARTEGRFALYSNGDPENPTKKAAATADIRPANEKTKAASTPAVVTDVDYESLTLAQLRARLPSLKVPDLEALLAYEKATKARAPFQTLLDNRITRATAK